MLGALSLLLTTSNGLPRPGLDAFRPYVGHCWAAALGTNVVDRHCFSLVYGGQHVRDEHVVTKNRAPVYSGETLYSVVAGKIVFTYWNSLGGVGHGTARANGNDLRFSLNMRASPGAAVSASTVSWRKTKTGYDVLSNGNTRHFKIDD